MLSSMMNRPLLISSLLDHATRCHADTEIVSRTIESGTRFELHRSTYREAATRSKRLANALKRLGVAPGERVGTFAWNGYRHFELYYGVSGMGAIIHTINPRLFPEQLTYIVNHADDQYIFFDLTFAPLLEKLAPTFAGVKGFVAMTDRAHMPTVILPNLMCYEELLAAESDDFDWPELDELTPSSLCYTSGTTGNPKGVLYSHRSTVIHTMGAMTADAFCLTSRDVVLPVVPMFHVNAWGLPYICAAAGVRPSQSPKSISSNPACSVKGMLDVSATRSAKVRQRASGDEAIRVNAGLLFAAIRCCICHKPAAESSASCLPRSTCAGPATSPCRSTVTSVAASIMFFRNARFGEGRHLRVQLQGSLQHRYHQRRATAFAQTHLQIQQRIQAKFFQRNAMSVFK